MDRQDLALDGDISILIGPNGGGKTNLLDAVVVLLRRYLFASMWAAHSPTADNPNRHEFRHNEVLNRLTLERHSQAPMDLDQRVEAVVQVSQQDVANMQLMKKDAERLLNLALKKYHNIPLEITRAWDLSAISAGQEFKYSLVNGSLFHDQSPGASIFLEYLQLFEIDGMLRDEYDLAPLATPMVYLPVSRSASGFQSSVQLANFQLYEQKRLADAGYSRSSASLIPLAVGRLAQRYRMLLERDSGRAKTDFYRHPNVNELTHLLRQLGYEWSLECVNPLRNEYDVRLSKQGSSFLVSGASSGELELLTYMFAIFALNVREALIVVDEPELHLNPKWQQMLLRLFARLSATTGNQFLLATHSPTFVGPESIQYVSRVYSCEQKSRLVRLNSAALPDKKHLFSIVNSQNNERIFFADKVVLVEGLSDRIVFERILDIHGRADVADRTVEVVSVGGKGLFAAYQKILNAAKVEHVIIADLDYLERIGTDDIRSFFVTNAREIKEDVIDNPKSLDGDALVSAIDTAMASGDWADAKAVWAYIKSRRRRLRDDLSADERSWLEAHVKELRRQGTFVLMRGSLEAYLPIGCRGKDIDKLIRVVRRQDFWDRLDEDARTELGEIARSILQ